jgi:hypothetical protein
MNKAIDLRVPMGAFSSVGGRACCGACGFGLGGRFEAELGAVVSIVFGVEASRSARLVHGRKWGSQLWGTLIPRGRSAGEERSA